eukprot:5506074-Ditylum_brightwellii.AAC.1
MSESGTSRADDHSADFDEIRDVVEALADTAEELDGQSFSNDGFGEDEEGVPYAIVKALDW